LREPLSLLSDSPQLDKQTMILNDIDPGPREFFGGLVISDPELEPD
jgi:hypothetical protein